MRKRVSVYLVLCSLCLQFILPLKVFAAAAELQIVLESSYMIEPGGAIMYHYSGDMWVADANYTPLEEVSRYQLSLEYDMNGDGIVTLEDIDYIICNVDTTYVSKILQLTQGEDNVKQACIDMLAERFRVSRFDGEVTVENLMSACMYVQLNDFLDNYSFLVCLYSLCTGESITTLSKGDLWTTAIMDSGDSTQGWYVVSNMFVARVLYALDSISEHSFRVDNTHDEWTGTPSTSAPTQGEDVFIIESEDVSAWLDEIVGGGVTDEGVDLPTGDDLSYSDKAQLTMWVDHTKDMENQSLYQALRVVRIIVGIVCIVYAVIFFLSYLLDKFNNLIDISLLGLVSLGRFIASADDTVSTFRSSGKEAKLLTFKDVVYISLGFLALGVLILSGALYTLVVLILDFINSRLGG